MTRLQYESKFDGFLVDLFVGTSEELNREMFGGEEVVRYACGATISSGLMPAETCGCLVWLDRFDGSPDCVSTLFHELVHASVLRLSKNGTLNRRPKAKDLRKGRLVSLDELMAHSVKELGEYFLAELNKAAEGLD